MEDMPEGAGILRRRGQERGMGRESYILLSKCKKPLNNNNKDNLKKKNLWFVLLGLITSILLQTCVIFLSYFL